MNAQFFLPEVSHVKSQNILPLWKLLSLCYFSSLKQLTDKIRVLVGLWSVFSTTVPVDFLFQQVFHPFLSKTGFLILLKSKDVRKYLHFLSWLYYFFFLSAPSLQYSDMIICQMVLYDKYSLPYKNITSASLMLRTGFWETSQPTSHANHLDLLWAWWYSEGRELLLQYPDMCCTYIYRRAESD